MKPYEHYLEAERLLEATANSTSAWEVETSVARAAVHAQLALVTPSEKETDEESFKRGYTQGLTDARS